MLILFLAAIVLNVTSQETGFIFGFKPDLVNEAFNSLLPQFNQDLPKYIPESLYLPSIGKNPLTVDLMLTNIQISSLHISDKSGVSFTNKREIIFRLTGISIGISFDWTISKNGKKIGDGSTSASISGASISSVAVVGDSNVFTVIVKDSSFSAGNFELAFANNNYSNALNWVIEAAKKKIQEFIENSVQNSFKDLIGSAVQYAVELGKVDKVKLTDDLELSLAMTKSPTIDNRHIHFSFEGVVRKAGENYEMNIPHPPPLDFITTKSSQISVSDYSLNSVIYAEYISKKLNFSTKALGLSINTNSLEAVFSGISEQYGENTDVNIFISPENPPLTSISDKGITANSRLVVNVTVRENSEEVILLGVDVKTVISLSLQDWVLKFEIDSIHSEGVSILHSNLAYEPDSNGIKNLINLTSSLSKREINKLLFGEGFPLPEDLEFFLHELSISLKEGYILIEAGNSQ